MVSRPVAVERWSVYLGVAIALAGIVLFATNLADATAAVPTSSEPARATPALAGLALLAGGLGLATTTRFGTPGLLAAFGVPLLAWGLAILGVGAGFGADASVQTATVASESAAPPPDGGLLLASGIVATMVGLGLLLVFGMRAKTSRR